MTHILSYIDTYIDSYSIDCDFYILYILYIIIYDDDIRFIMH